MTNFGSNNDIFTESNAKKVNKRKLVLHFDQHNTIQVACTLPGRRITVEEGLNNFLTSVVWGKEVDNKWVWISTEPQMYKPLEDENAETYFKYLEKKIVKSPDDRAELKKRTCRFVYEEIGAQFLDFFHLYLRSLTYENNYDFEINETSANTAGIDLTEDETNYYYNNNKDKYRRKSLTHDDKSKISATKLPKLPPNTIPADDSSNKSLYHLILPDFFDMIRRLQKDNRNFSIILRTMGIDSQNFLDTIKPIFEGKHRDFKDIKPIKINSSIGHLRRFSNDRIELEIDNELFTTDETIYAKICSLEGVNAIRDDFAYWQKNDYECYSAKPLWINLEDMDHQHILFDDNIRLNNHDDCIVNIRLNNAALNEYCNVEFGSYNLFEKCSILQPNLIMLLNPHLRSDSTKNHYSEKIKKAETIYSDVLQNINNLRVCKKSQCLNSNSNSYKAEPADAGTCNNVFNLSSNSDFGLCFKEKHGQSSNLNFEKNKTFVSINKPFDIALKDIDKNDQKISSVCSVQ